MANHRDDMKAGSPSRRRPPRRWRQMQQEYPTVALAYDALRGASDGAGPLDERTLAIVKLAVSVGGHISRTTRVHAKKALAAGVEPAVLRQVAVVALPTIGLPKALDALDWIEESLAEAVSAAVSVVGSAGRTKAP